MRIIETKVFLFDELSEAKEKARDWYRYASAGDNFFSECVIEDAKQLARLIGINIENIYFSGFSSQGDGACFTGTLAYEKGAVAAVKKYAPTDTAWLNLAQQWQAAQAKTFYKARGQVSHHGNYSHENSTHFDWYECNEEQADELSEVARDIMRHIYTELAKEYDWYNDDAQIDEAILANGYEFTEEGDIA